MNIGESDGLGKFLGDLDSSFSEIVVSSSPPGAIKKVNVDEGYTSCIRIRGRPILPPIMSQVITMTKVVDTTQYLAMLTGQKPSRSELILQISSRCR